MSGQFQTIKESVVIITIPDTARFHGFLSLDNSTKETLYRIYISEILKKNLSVDIPANAKYCSAKKEQVSEILKTKTKFPKRLG